MGRSQLFIFYIIVAIATHCKYISKPNQRSMKKPQTQTAPVSPANENISKSIQRDHKNSLAHGRRSICKSSTKLKNSVHSTEESAAGVSRKRPVTRRLRKRSLIRRLRKRFSKRGSKRSRSTRRGKSQKRRKSKNKKKNSSSRRKGLSGSDRIQRERYKKKNDDIDENGDQEGEFQRRGLRKGRGMGAVGQLVIIFFAAGFICFYI